MALRAGGSAPNITAFHFRESVALVSGQCGVPQWPGTTKLSRGIFQQRGHVSPPVAALGGNGTSPLDPVRCSVVSASGQGGVPPCPRTTKLSLGMRGSCGTRPLRQNYITPHCSQCPPVSRKLLLWQPPLRALRVKATGVMQNCLRWSRSHSRRRFPVVGTPYAPPSARPCGCRGTVALGRRCALCGWSVACGQSCGVFPRPRLCFAAARHQPCALVCPSAPRGGSLSPRALVAGLCYKFSSCSRTEYAGYRPNGL